MSKLTQSEETGENMIQIGDYNVRKVFKGDRYGLDDCLIHDSEEPLVEFYKVSQKWGDRGFFVSRYYFGTLLNKPGFYGRLRDGDGLCLHGDRYNYHSISADEVRAVKAFIRSDTDTQLERGC